MSIEIYNKAKVIKKDSTYYYFLKHHSKNDCICGGQYIVDDKFNDKFIRRDSRAGSWSIKAHGTEKEHNSHAIALTDWNCPTSYAYGQIRFGNKKNIALYWSKCKVENYNDFTDEQKRNIDEEITHYLKPENSRWACDLSNIPTDKQGKSDLEYCDKTYCIGANHLVFAGIPYWNLDNL